MNTRFLTPLTTPLSRSKFAVETMEVFILAKTIVLSVGDSFQLMRGKDRITYVENVDPGEIRLIV